MATGMVGLAGLGLSALMLAGSGIGPWERVLILLAATGIPMILWAVVVEKIHRNPGTGLDYAHPRPLSQTLETTKVKLLGLWSTWFPKCVTVGYDRSSSPCTAMPTLTRLRSTRCSARPRRAADGS